MVNLIHLMVLYVCRHSYIYIQTFLYYRVGIDSICKDDPNATYIATSIKSRDCSNKKHQNKGSSDGN